VGQDRHTVGNNRRASRGGPSTDGEEAASGWQHPTGQPADRAARQIHGMPGRLVATPGGCSGNTALPRWLGFGLTGMPQAGGNGGNTDADDQSDSGFARRHPCLAQGPKPGAIRASLFSARI